MMNKKMKIMTVILVAVLMLGFAALPVMAAARPAESRPPLGDRLQNHQDVLDLRIGLLENQLAGLKLARENNALRIQLHDLLVAQKDSLTEENKEALRELHGQIRERIEQLRETQGDIHAILKEQREDGRPDLDEMKAAYEEIAVIQQARLDLLGQINEILIACIQLLG